MRSAPRARQPNPVPGRAAQRREPGQAASPHTRGGGGGGGEGGSSELHLWGGAGAGPPADWSSGSDGQPACPVFPLWPPRAGPRAAPKIVGPTFVPAQWPVWPWGGPVIRSSTPGLSIHCKSSSGLRLCPLPGPVFSSPHAASPRGRTRAGSGPTSLRPSCRCSPELWFSRPDSPCFPPTSLAAAFRPPEASLPLRWVLSQFPRRPDPSHGVTPPRPPSPAKPRHPSAKAVSPPHPTTCSTSPRNTDISPPSSNCFSHSLHILRTWH